MTTTADPRRKDYVGNGALDTYPIPFRIFSSSDIKVYVAGSLKTLGVHYTVTGSFPGTGNVVFAAGNIPALNAAIIIEGDMAVTQPADLASGQQFYEETIEQMSDRVTMLLQEIRQRAPMFPLGHSIPGPIPFPALAASKFLRTNPAGTGLEMVNGALSDIVGVLDDVVPVSADAGFPVAGTAGRLRGKNDGQRGLWMDDGSRWLPTMVFRTDWYGAGPAATAAENKTAIQAAFTAAAASGSGGRVVYIVGDALNIDVSGGPIDTLGVPFFGDGPERTKLFPTTSHSVFKLSLGSGEAGNLSINYGGVLGADPGAVAIQLHNVGQCRIHNITVWNCYRAFQLLTTYGTFGNIFLTTFDNIIVSGPYDWAHYIDSTSDSTTLLYHSCHVYGRDFLGLAGGASKGWYANNLTTLVKSNCAMDGGDGDTNGSILSFTNGHQVFVDTFHLEGHHRTTGGVNSSPFYISGGAYIGNLFLSGYDVDVGAGIDSFFVNCGYPCSLVVGSIRELSPVTTSGNRKIANVASAQSAVILPRSFGVGTAPTLITRALLNLPGTLADADARVSIFADRFYDSRVKQHIGVLDVVGGAGATKILDLPSPYGYGPSGLFMVTGFKGGAGVAFSDLIMLTSDNTGVLNIKVVSADDVGAAAARTYSWAADELKLSLAGADSYHVSVHGHAHGKDS